VFRSVRQSDAGGLIVFHKYYFCDSGIEIDFTAQLQIAFFDGGRTRASVPPVTYPADLEWSKPSN